MEQPAEMLKFKNHYDREDHHPDLTVGYNKSRVEYSTHAFDGLSENDFICAAKADALFQL